MSLSIVELRTMAERASNLGERLSGSFRPVASDGTAGARRLVRWKQLAAGNDPKRFASLLQLWGLENASDEALGLLLGPVEYSDAAPLPSWTVQVNECVAAVGIAFASYENGSRIPPVPPGVHRQIPYVHLYWPMGDQAWSRVHQRLGVATTVLNTKARDVLQRQLAQRISDIASPSLHLAYLVHQSFTTTKANAYLFGAESQSPRITAGLYESFVSKQGRDGLRSLFLRNPVVARLVATVRQQWIESTAEFLERLHVDKDLLASQFNMGRPLGWVTSIKAGVSDPHHGGRTVSLLGFQSGVRLVYKPRSLGVDGFFNDFLKRLNTCLLGPKLRELTMVDRGNYGWVEFAKHQPCADLDAAQRFYHRAGALTCAAHWLGGIDFYRENLVAAGEHPVIIDLEALAHPPLEQEILATAASSTHLLSGSVLRTGLLPLLLPRPGNFGYTDNSALAAPASFRPWLASARWRHINTDAMQVDVTDARQRYSAHRARIGRQMLSAKRFEESLLAGYTETAVLLETTTSGELMKIRRAIWNCQRRRIKRPTLVYAALIQRSLQTDCLGHGVDRSIELQALPLLDEDREERATEIRSMEELDVPYFQHRGHGDSPAPSLLDQTGQIRLALQGKLRLELGRIVDTPPNTRKVTT